MTGHLLAAKGRAKPPPEPALRTQKVSDGWRVGAHLNTELYVAFKSYVARSGSTGEQAIVAAIEQLLRRR
jgi:hypothetical protein